MERALPDVDFQRIAAAFRLEGEVASFQPFGSGHINDTFYLKNTLPAAPDYLLQRINHHVFKNIPALMQNIERVTTHLRAKAGRQMQSAPLEVLTLVPTHDGQYFIQDAAGNYWRVLHFLQDTISYDIVLKPTQAEAGGAAFGQFQALLADLPADRLSDTIPDFHNIEKRLVTFHAAVAGDSHHRVAALTDEIDFVKAREHSMGKIQRWGRQGMLPLRITHNDTKFNNVLLDLNDRARCVIDLDTVMPGYAAYDFGDAIRSLVNTAAEDEKDLAKIDVNLGLFEAFTRGFLRETHHVLTQAEVQSLTWGVLLFPYLMGVRFLTDYIEGDVYYKTAFEGQNLQRCRAQFQLLRKLEAHAATLENCVNSMAAVYAGKASKNEDSTLP